MNLKAFTRKDNPIAADKNQTLTKMERNMRKHGGRRRAEARRRPLVLAWKALFVSAFDFYPREWGFPFEWRLWASFSKHLAFDLFTHVPFIILSCSLAPIYLFQKVIYDSGAKIRLPTCTLHESNVLGSYRKIQPATGQQISRATIWIRSQGRRSNFWKWKCLDLHPAHVRW